MHTTRQYSHSYTLRQRGAALFMALIFLLILTILGVFGMNISRLENLMAGNTQFQTTALNNAEYVLIRGENDISAIAASSGNPFNPDTAGDRYYPIGTTTATGTPPSRPEDLVWTFPSQKVSIPDFNGDGSDTDGDGTPDDGVGFYIIEDAGLDNSAGEDSSFTGTINPLAGAIVQVFQVTAQSSSSRGAKRIVQSVLVTDPLTP
jgi:Tfp pilus assembly protein PilX